jgi:DNA helicase HerA-like ATPase
VELLSLSEEKGTRLRATVSEFGPVLLSKILGLNDTQGGVMALIFKFCDDNKLPLLDLKDLKKVLQFISNEGKDAITAEYGAISTTSTGTMLRKIIELEQQGAERFFGEKSFEVEDLCRISDTGLGMISILRLTDLQDRPKLFSTFMLCMMAEIYSTFPEAGDLDAPKLIIFIDEAHLMFEEASKALNDQIETMVKLIRSKGVGLYFCTQNPQDVPDAVLAQLGLKVQHALRAFTAKDRKEIKTASENFPETTYYKVDELLTQLGIGEALITALSEKGIPTPLVATMLIAPSSRMDILTPQEIGEIERHSKIGAKYNQEVDRESAYELLECKLNDMQEAEKQEDLKKEQEKAQVKAEKEAKKATGGRQPRSTIEKVVTSPVTNTIAREVTRGILGVLGLGGRSRGGRGKSSRKGFGWF